MQATAEKENAIEQTESLLRAEQGQNKVLRSQNKALFERLNNLRGSDRTSVDEQPSSKQNALIAQL